MDKLDWTLTQSFLAVAETGSLSAAARALRLSQPTLGRHIADLEQALGMALFTRQPRGLLPTAEAAALIPHARAMRTAAMSLSLAAAGRDQAVAGTVRITASRIVSHFILPAILADLRLSAPQIEIELAPTDDTDNLLFREADIAVRMYRPTQLGLITTHLCDLPTGIYAAHSFIAAHGMPQTFADLPLSRFIGFDKSDIDLRQLADLGIAAKRSDFPVRCDDHIVYWNLVRAGLGMGGTQTIIGDGDPSVVRVAPFVPLPSLPVWLTAPQALHQSPRIRRVYDALAAGFRALDPLRITR